jgi:ribose 5-phosphate isomerase B
MKVAIGADHKGFDFKESVKAILIRMGHEVQDMGAASSEESVDYPDFGLKVARAVAEGSADRGITVCWTGNGMNIVANKIKGVRAGMALMPEMAYFTRLHNDANVLTLSGKYTPENQLEEIISTFLETEFEGGRHIPRVDKITSAERNG